MTKNKYMIRDYEHADFFQVEKLWEETGMGGKARGDNHEVIEATIQNGGKLLILEDVNSEKIIGTSWLTNDKRRIYLHHFGIKPEYQGKGLSKELLVKSIEFAKKVNLQIKLEVHKDNERAINLYKKYGFRYLGDYLVYIIRNYE